MSDSIRKLRKLNPQDLGVFVQLCPKSRLYRPNSGGRVVHSCGNPRIHIFNIVQHDPYIAGKTIPVKAEIYPCQEASFSEAGRRGEEAAEEFKKRMFG